MEIMKYQILACQGRGPISGPLRIQGEILRRLGEEVPALAGRTLERLEATRRTLAPHRGAGAQPAHDEAARLDLTVNAPKVQRDVCMPPEATFIGQRTDVE